MVSSSRLNDGYKTAQEIAEKIRGLHGVSDVLIPQDLDYPALRLNVNREMASRLGLSSHEVVDNVITALNSGGDTMPGIDYTVVASRNDSISTPPEATFLTAGPGATVEIYNQHASCGGGFGIATDSGPVIPASGELVVRIDWQTGSNLDLLVGADYFGGGGSPLSAVFPVVAGKGYELILNSYYEQVEFELRADLIVPALK